jgi:hypothetical protein
MQRSIEHTMTQEQLMQFMIANGLRRKGEALLAPEGEVVGWIAGTDQGPVRVTTVEETRTDDGHQVRAWWPASRPSWTILTADGGLEVGGLLGPDAVICDVCNALVVQRPVPVVNGYAQCADCFANLGIRLPGSVCLYCPLSHQTGTGVDR